MKKNFYKILILILLLMPTTVFASSGSNNFVPIFFFLFMIIIIIIPSYIKKLLKKANENNNRPWSLEEIKNIKIRCEKCGNTNILMTDKFCSNCGASLANNYGILNKYYYFTIDEIVEDSIENELSKAGYDKKTKLIPREILKKKQIFNFIFSLLVLIYITMIFFHFPILTYILGFIIIIIYFILTRNYSLMKYLKKQVKSRPSEKISNIVMNTMNSLTLDTSWLYLTISLIISVFLPLIIFSSPRIIYEKVDNGYNVRYYLYGLTNYKTVVIPDTYKNEKIVGLRGNTFSNMYFLESVKLPDTITEIRGQAFKNCLNLTSVNIPSNLEYLGGGAFKNALKIKSITLPDTLTFLGGEAFSGASSLENIKLSNNLTEIRGDTFSSCSSLKSIDIPDKVVRIGGHAFYENYKLETVSISENSKLTEIGSSAFRYCYALTSIKIPSNTYVNERAFKESPTIISRY